MYSSIRAVTEVQTPGRIQKEILLEAVIFRIGVLESRIEGSTFWILPGDRSDIPLVILILHDRVYRTSRDYSSILKCN